MFIDMCELTPCYQSNDNDFQLQLDKNMVTSIIRKRSKNSISLGEWNEAFDVFTVGHVKIKATSIDHTIHLTQELLTYKRNINQVAKQNGDWRSLDIHFRKDLESSFTPWSTVRWDLLLLYNSYNRPTVATNQGQAQSNLNYRRRGGTCNTYNKYGTCTRNNCRYSHACSQCSGSHAASNCQTKRRNPVNKFNPTRGGKNNQQMSGSNPRPTMNTEKNTAKVQ